MTLWMRWVWMMAALTVLFCLVTLGSPTGVTAGDTSMPTATGYFTISDPVCGTVHYGMHEGGHTLFYNSLPAMP
jgi:hypothetical protein